MEGSHPAHRSRRRAALISVGVGFAMLGIKMGAYLATGSAAILSDALESVVHVAATTFMFFCFRLAALPPDENHPYGHGKAEHLSIGFEGGMILLAALAILWQALRNLLGAEHEVQQVGIGFVLILSAAALNLLLGLYLLHVGKVTRSGILIADGRHVLSDVWTSLSVLASLLVMWWVPDPTHRLWIDSGAAILIAGIIIVTAVKLIRHAVAGLLDEVDRAMLERVVAAINEIRQPEWLDIHHLRLRSSGDILHVDFHLTVPGSWTIAQGHEAEEALEEHILHRLGMRGSVFIHFDYPKNHAGEPTPAGGIPPLPLTIDSALRITGMEAQDSPPPAAPVPPASP